MSETAGRIDIAFTERQGGRVARLTLDNAAKLNTLNSALMERFVGAIEALGTEKDLRALVLTGAGERAFIGGADIREMGAIATPDEAEAFITRLHRACRALRALPVPVLARIDGYCLGAGLEIAASCDLRLASERAHFAMPEVRVGIPSVIEAALLPGLIGWGRTRRLVLLAETIDAPTALDWGLVEKVVAPDALDAACEEWLDGLLAAGPRALRLQKALVRQWEDLPVGEAIQAGISCFAEAWESDEPRRMMAAFTERKRR